MRFGTLALAASCLAACSNPPGVQPADHWDGPQGSWREVWRDDFDGPAGSAPSAANWNVELRAEGQNDELDYNTNERRNSFLDGAGHLVIQALAEHYEFAPGEFSSQPYTSARLNTRHHIEPQHGRVEARMQLPEGIGLWPAFWLLASSYENVGWPECGEIDIMELAGRRANVASGSLHGPGYSGGSALTAAYELASGSFADDFHVFAFEWTKVGMRWLVDEQVYHSRTRAGMERMRWRWVFDQPFFVIVNLAVGGVYDGAPDASTPFPSRMLIDYIKISELQSD